MPRTGTVLAEVPRRDAGATQQSDICAATAVAPMPPAVRARAAAVVVGRNAFASSRLPDVLAGKIMQFADAQTFTVVAGWTTAVIFAIAQTSSG